MSRSDTPPEELNFNDAPSNEISGRRQSDSPVDGSLDAQTGNSQVSKIKRIACTICRKRKLRCDGARPSCGTCSRLAHNCAYDDVRKKSGPKRGYVKELEAKLSSYFS